MTELMRVTIGDLLDSVTTRYPENDSIVDITKGVRYSYREFLRIVNQLAKGFLKIGLKKGEHIALWAPNISEWIITEFAVAKIGCVLISVDTNCQLQQLHYLLRQSDSQSLIMSEGLKGYEYLDLMHQLCPEIRDAIPGRLHCQNLPELKNVIVISNQAHPGALTWKEILEMGENVSDSALADRQRSCRYDDVVTILYTSGTTGAPKGVMSTHFGIMNTSLASAENQRLTEKDRLCLSVPLSHMFGSVCIILAGIIKGATIVIPSETFHARRILKAIEQEGCNAIYGSPSAFTALMEDSEYDNMKIRSLRTGIMGGAQCPMEVMKKVVDNMGVKEIIIGYGQTEASSWITTTRPDDPLELRVSTVGKPLPNLEIKVIDPQSGQEVSSGGSGEICARGFNMKGYYKLPSATANTIDSEGWLHTGDLGTMDGEGYLRTTGRLKEIITKGKETIYPTEIEEVLYRHPKISNVQVFGVPDKVLGEEVATWIKLQEGITITEKEILQYCEGRLPSSHIPRYVKFVKEFSTTPLGKVQKFKMRESAIKEYGLE
jgi:fatty-acyl-CoA synthase